MNLHPKNDVTNDRRKSFIEFKVCFRYLNWPSLLCLGNFLSSVSKIHSGFFSTKNSLSFLVLVSFHNFRLTLCFHLFSEKHYFNILESFLEIIYIFHLRKLSSLYVFPVFYWSLPDCFINSNHCLLHNHPLVLLVHW